MKLVNCDNIPEGEFAVTRRFKGMDIGEANKYYCVVFMPDRYISEVPIVVYSPNNGSRNLGYSFVNNLYQFEVVNLTMEIKDGSK